MRIHQHLLLLFFIITIPFTESQNCQRSCPYSSLPHVPYPFGFSDSCPIRLNCTNGTVLIDRYRVLNITSDTILVSLPAKCNRSISEMAPLFGRNYSPTWRNALLLDKCTTPRKDCTVPPPLFDRQFGQLQGCGQPSCFAKDNAQGGDSGFMGYANVSGSGCEHLYSSMAVIDPANNSSASVSLEFQVLQLGWWVKGGCDWCAFNATCTAVVSPVDGAGGLRCRCDAGFVGDGFKDGSRCQRVSSNCNPTKYLSGRCGASRKIGVLIGGIIAGAALVIVIVLLWYLMRRRTKYLKSRQSIKHLLSETACSCSVPIYSYKEVERATFGFSEKHTLGTGAYGTVYAGKLNNDEWVAIKKIRYRDRDGIEQVMNEIKIISSVSHPNLVRLLGFCLERDEQILIYEFMPNGTLSQHLQRERGSGLPWTIRLSIATETAQAIAYLHSSVDPPIYHRDIKSSNILLDRNFNSKVADFGLSRLGMTETSHISTAPQGTPGYLDPEYHQNFYLSDKSDVYSFGVVLVEILTARKVVDFTRPPNYVNLAALAIDKIGRGCVEDIIDPVLEPHRDAWTLSSVHKVAELAFRCLAFHRDMRPSMTEVAAELEQIKFSGWAPLEENIVESPVPSCTSSVDINIGSESPEVSIVASMTRQKTASELKREEFVVSSTDRDARKSCSPVSVEAPWFSEQSSPSSNSLLDNVIR
ncbi:hypothetical protein Sjap_016808 [Stephania japonica]|uniref:Protein kinase domain-containing protein n=1 Tax=Stephania japonica TaxID=461633 RepID=A0AAP0I4Z6_9MAGN